MTAQAAQEPDSETVKAQLFRYAQDLGELMHQHKRLELQHRMILQSLGREWHSDEMLVSLLAQSTDLFWVSTAQGNLLRASSAARQELDAQGVKVPGANIAQLLVAEQRDGLRAVLERFAERGSHAPGLQWRLQMAPLPDAPAPPVYDTLALQVMHNGRFEIYWFLQPARESADHGLQLQMDLVRAVVSDHGMLLTTPYGDICAINPAVCSMTGYDEAELLGNNPRMLSSGRHDNAFYQDFWLEVLERGGWSGTIFNRRKGGQIFLEWQTIRMVENEAGEVMSYISAMEDLSFTDPASKRLKTMAYSDPLTGLPNRRMMVERLEQTLGRSSSDTQLAVLFMDLNRFKPINDELGHEMGDLVLREVAHRMQAALQPGDLLARVGGDEFVILFIGAKRAMQAEQVAAQLQKALQPSMHIAGRLLSVGASMGCALYPQDALDAVALIKHADTAMYTSKRLALPFCAYHPDMEMHQRLNLETDLWHALERGEISLVYQPQIRSQSNDVLRGCEALMRWNHPVAGEVEPALFIALAEKSGAIVPLGNWALRHACEQLQAWRQQGLRSLTLSLNVSLRQLREPGFLALVEHTLLAHALPPELLEFELSESQTVLFQEGDTQHIRALRTLGVRIAIDDFGISFNSLARLNTLSISSLKINAQCVQDLASSADARAISNCMIAIGQVMGIEVIAQGVESSAQADVLQQQGCRVMQGFYAGRPVSAAALQQALSGAGLATA